MFLTEMGNERLTEVISGGQSIKFWIMDKQSANGSTIGGFTIIYPFNQKNKNAVFDTHVR